MEIKKVLCSSLKVDTSYQRNPQTTRVRKIAKEWNDDFANTLYISQREDGAMYVVDGNHTRLASIMAKGNDATLLAKVFTGLTKEEEAEMFIKLNTTSKKPNYAETLRARVRVGEPFAVSYINALEEANVDYTLENGGSSVPRLRGHKIMMDVFKSIGFISFVQALKYAKECIPDKSTFCDSSILAGFTYFVGTNPGIDTESFKKRIKKADLDAIHGQVKAIRKSNLSSSTTSTVKIYADIFRGLYNKGRSTGRIQGSGTFE